MPARANHGSASACALMRRRRRPTQSAPTRPFVDVLLMPSDVGTRRRPTSHRPTSSATFLMTSFKALCVPRPFSVTSVTCARCAPFASFLVSSGFAAVGADRLVRAARLRRTRVTVQGAPPPRSVVRDRPKSHRRTPALPRDKLPGTAQRVNRKVAQRWRY